MAKNQTDIIMSSDRQIVGDCKVITNANIGSDQRMVRARVEINKKLISLKKTQNQKHSNLTVEP